MEPIDPYSPATPGYQRELGFAPCRDDDCRRIGDRVHPRHPVSPRMNGRIPRTCPVCLTKLGPINAVTRLVACLKPGCGWQRQAGRRTRTGKPGRPRKGI